MVRSFDVIVIGAGSGMEVVSEAVERGLKVAVIEDGPFGGTCHNRGCIPSKMLIHCADILETIKTAERFGIKANVQGFDWDFIMDRVYKDLDAEAASMEEASRQHPLITVYKDAARFVGERTLEVGEAVVTAPSIVIAAGTRPSVPSIPGTDSVPYITSGEALRLRPQPRSMAIVGGGFVAAELAHFFGTFGTKVTLIHRRSTLLREEDEEVSSAFTEVFRNKLDFIPNATVQEVRHSRGGVALTVEGSGARRTVEAEALLFATGRIPNTDILDVGKAGVEVDDHGFVKTDGYLRTTAYGVWAFGDVVGKYQLKHNANLEAAYVVHNLFNPDSLAAVDHHAMPHAVFTSPQVASGGMTEQAAKAQNIPYVVARYDYKNTAYGASIEDNDGFVKVLAHAETKEIIGCHIMGTDASILIHEAGIAMRVRLGPEAITQAIYVHPALSEVLQRAFSSLRF